MKDLAFQRAKEAAIGDKQERHGIFAIVVTAVEIMQDGKAAAVGLELKQRAVLKLSIGGADAINGFVGRQNHVDGRCRAFKLVQIAWSGLLGLVCRQRRHAFECIGRVPAVVQLPIEHRQKVQRPVSRKVQPAVAFDIRCDSQHILKYRPLQAINHHEAVDAVAVGLFHDVRHMLPVRAECQVVNAEVSGPFRAIVNGMDQRFAIAADILADKCHVPAIVVDRDISDVRVVGHRRRLIVDGDFLFHLRRSVIRCNDLDVVLHVGAVNDDAGNHRIGRRDGAYVDHSGRSIVRAARGQHQAAGARLKDRGARGNAVESNGLAVLKHGKCLVGAAHAAGPVAAVFTKDDRAGDAPKRTEFLTVDHHKLPLRGDGRVHDILAIRRDLQALAPHVLWARLAVVHDDRLALAVKRDVRDMLAVVTDAQVLDGGI